MGIVPCQKGNAMQQQCSHETASILHELDLGQHTLFIMSDGSIDLLADDEQTPYRADIGGTVFYVGKGTSLFRMDNHFTEAASGCDCDKCGAIRSVWNAGLVVVRRIVFETTDEQEAMREEKARIAQHRSPYLTNVHGDCGTRRVAKVEEKEQIIEPHWMLTVNRNGTAHCLIFI